MTRPKVNTDEAVKGLSHCERCNSIVSAQNLSVVPSTRELVCAACWLDAAAEDEASTRMSNGNR